jgi:hypothetical protein
MVIHKDVRATEIALQGTTFNPNEWEYDVETCYYKHKTMTFDDGRPLTLAYEQVVNFSGGINRVQKPPLGPRPKGL